MISNLEQSRINNKRFNELTRQLAKRRVTAKMPKNFTIFTYDTETISKLEVLEIVNQCTSGMFSIYGHQLSLQAQIGFMYQSDLTMFKLAIQ